MGILSWLVLGAFSGWIASIIMNKNESMGAVANIFTGIVGAFIEEQYFTSSVDMKLQV